MCQYWEIFTGEQSVTTSPSFSSSEGRWLSAERRWQGLLSAGTSSVLTEMSYTHHNKTQPDKHSTHLMYTLQSQRKEKQTDKDSQREREKQDKEEEKCWFLISTEHRSLNKEYERKSSKGDTIVCPGAALTLAVSLSYLHSEKGLVHSRTLNEINLHKSSTHSALSVWVVSGSLCLQWLNILY